MHDLLKETYGTNAESIVGQYPLSDYSSSPSALGTVWSDFRSDVGINNCIYLETAKLIRKSVLRLSIRLCRPQRTGGHDQSGVRMGAVHSSELIYQFPHFDNTTKLAVRTWHRPRRNWPNR